MSRISAKGGRVHAPMRAAAWYCVGGGIGKAVGLIATPFFTRLLTSEEYAILPLFLTWVGILGAFSGISGASGVRVRMELDRERYGEGLTAALLGYGFLQIGICMVLYFALYPILKTVGAPSVGLSLLIFLQLIADGAIGLELTRMRAIYKYRTVVLVGIILCVIPQLASYIIITLFGGRGEYRVFGMLAASLAVAVPFAYRALRHGRPYNRDIWGCLFRTELPMLPKSIAAALLSGADRLLITAFYGVGALSAYTISHSVGAAGGFVVTAVSAAISPWVLKRIADGRSDGIREACDSGGTLLTVSAVLICGIAPELLSILAPRGYNAPLSVIAPLALSAAPTFLLGISSAALASEGHGFSAAAPGVAAAVLSIGLNAISFRFLPFSVAAFNYFLSNLAALYLAAILQKRSGGALIFSSGRLLLSLAVGGLLCGTALAYEYSIAMRGVLMLLAITLSLPLAIGFLSRVGLGSRAKKRSPKA